MSPTEPTIVLPGDANRYHVMRSHLYQDTYVSLVWPKDLALKHLEFMREMVNFQIDAFIASARRETRTEEAARLEVESWSAHLGGAGALNG